MSTRKGFVNSLGNWSLVIVLVICSVFLGSALFTGEMLLSHYASDSSRTVAFEESPYEFIALSIFYAALIILCLIVIFPKFAQRIEDALPGRRNIDNKEGIEKVRKAYRKS